MEFKSVSSKISREEFTQLSDYCKKKGITVSSLIHNLLLQEIKIPIPHNVSGKNNIEYNAAKDNFTWSVILDDGSVIEVMKNISPRYLENLNDIISRELEKRDSITKKKNKDSVPVPGGLLRRRK